ncbi:MAG: hypothetical protein COA78_05575 [Blastopirellula sp.]|nr:MAG: hypothetical protein COA78_05575 [Blastopirellula sp.]
MSELPQFIFPKNLLAHTMSASGELLNCGIATESNFLIHFFDTTVTSRTPTTINNLELGISNTSIDLFRFTANDPINHNSNSLLAHLFDPAVRGFDPRCMVISASSLSISDKPASKSPAGRYHR